MANTITYGLENVHIAFAETVQAESIEVTADCGTDGEMTVAVTATTLLGADSPKSVKVPVSAEDHDTVTKVASAVCNVLNNNAVINAVFIASHAAGVITLKAREAAANDASLAIAFTVGATGVTVGSSTNVTAGSTGYGTPTAVAGAVRLTPSAQGQESTFYADNLPYYVVTANNGYTAELEMALVTDAMLAEMLGWSIDDNGMLVEVSTATPKRFALMGQIAGDDKNRRFVYYDCQASRPAKEQKTKGETIEPNTDVLTLTIFPKVVGSLTVVKGVMELSATNTSAYNAFFGAVYEPVFA